MLGRAAPRWQRRKANNLNITRTPPARGFCFPAIRQGYSRGALHQYPCHIVDLIFHKYKASQFCGAFSFQAHGNHPLRALLINPARKACHFHHTQLYFGRNLQMFLFFFWEKLVIIGSSCVFEICFCILANASLTICAALCLVKRSNSSFRNLVPQSLHSTGQKSCEL